MHTEWAATQKDIRIKLPCKYIWNTWANIFSSLDRWRCSYCWCWVRIAGGQPWRTTALDLSAEELHGEKCSLECCGGKGCTSSLTGLFIVTVRRMAKVLPLLLFFGKNPRCDIALKSFWEQRPGRCSEFSYICFTFVSLVSANIFQCGGGGGERVTVTARNENVFDACVMSGAFRARTLRFHPVPSLSHSVQFSRHVSRLLLSTGGDQTSPLWWGGGVTLNTSSTGYRLLMVFLVNLRGILHLRFFKSLFV